MGLVKRYNAITEDARAQQYGHEVNTWLRTLDYLQQENIYLKNRVADLLQYDVHSDYLDKIEYFHNKFIDKDAVLSLLRHDMIELAAKVDLQDERTTKQALQKEEHLRRDMEKMETEFSRLKSDFNEYVFGVLLPASA